MTLNHWSARPLMEIRMTDSVTARRNFSAFIASIADPSMRERIYESAIANGCQAKTEIGFWKLALSTAEDILDDPRGYYPDVFTGED